MAEDFINISRSLDTLTLAQVAERINVKDIETAKKHDTFHSEVITGKAGGLASGADIDSATNAVTGHVQTTLPKVLRDVGFKPASFNFVTGGTLGVADADKCIHNPAPAGDGRFRGGCA